MICFDVASLYYLPQYMPVARVLRERRVEVVFMLRSDEAYLMTAAAQALKAESFSYVTIKGQNAALAWYVEQRPQWIVFGNGCPFLKNLSSPTKTALLYHGIGVKSCYYDADLSEFDVRFTEGAFRTSQLQGKYPGCVFADVGFAKLDPLLNGSSPNLGVSLRDLGLDPNRATILYAPTYYPSSIECLPKDWPATLAELNIIIKPHMLTWSSDRYRKQQDLLRSWQAYPNVHLAEVGSFSLLPYMAISQVLVSEASSAIFEFAALNKPIVWCDFYRLRWSYRGIFKYRHERRMDQTIQAFKDVGAHAASAKDLASVIRQELAEPQRHAVGRLRCTQELIGSIDGLASQRVADHLMSFGV